MTFSLVMLQSFSSVDNLGAVGARVGEGVGVVYGLHVVDGVVLSLVGKYFTN